MVFAFSTPFRKFAMPLRSLRSDFVSLQCTLAGSFGAFQTGNGASQVYNEAPQFAKPHFHIATRLRSLRIGFASLRRGSAVCGTASQVCNAAPQFAEQPRKLAIGRRKCRSSHRPSAPVPADLRPSASIRHQRGATALHLTRRRTLWRRHRLQHRRCRFSPSRRKTGPGATSKAIDTPREATRVEP